MEGIATATDASVRGAQDTPAQSVARPRVGRSGGRPVSVSQESKDVSLRHMRETDTGGARPREHPGLGFRQVSWVPSATGLSGAASSSHRDRDPTYSNVRTYVNLAVPGCLAPDEAAGLGQQIRQLSLTAPRESSIARCLSILSSQSKPAPTPRPLPVARQFHEGGAVAGENARLLEPYVQPPYRDAKCRNVVGAARRAEEESYEQTSPRQRTQSPPLVPLRQPHCLLSSVVRQSGAEAVAGTTAKCLEPVVQPARPESSFGKVSVATEAVAEAIYEKFDPPSLAGSPLPRQRFTPLFQSGSGATAAGQPAAYLEPLSLEKDPVQVYRRLALAQLHAAGGVEGPELELVRLYRRYVRGETHFDQQVRYAAESYEEEAQRDAYLLAIFEIAEGDKCRFRQLNQSGNTEQQRRCFGGRAYAKQAAEIKVFVGPTAKEYLASFDGQPVEIHERVYKDALASALERAMGTGAVPLPIPADATRV